MKTKTKKRVFCKECNNLERAEVCGWKCKLPTGETKYSWYNEFPYYQDFDPTIKNANNDCKDFKKKIGRDM